MQGEDAESFHASHQDETERKDATMLIGIGKTLQNSLILRGRGEALVCTHRYFPV